MMSLLLVVAVGRFGWRVRLGCTWYIGTSKRVRELRGCEVFGREICTCDKVYLSVCVCVCVRERERESTHQHIIMSVMHSDGGILLNRQTQRQIDTETPSLPPV